MRLPSDLIVNNSGHACASGDVPAGRYTNPRVCDPVHVRAVAAAFQRRNITIDCRPFDEALAEAARGDFVYCDPPYAPLSRTSSFANYTAAVYSFKLTNQFEIGYASAVAVVLTILLVAASAMYVRHLARKVLVAA